MYSVLAVIHPTGNKSISGLELGYLYYLFIIYFLTYFIMLYLCYFRDIQQAMEPNTTNNRTHNNSNKSCFIENNRRPVICITDNAVMRLRLFMRTYMLCATVLTQYAGVVKKKKNRITWYCACTGDHWWDHGEIARTCYLCSIATVSLTSMPEVWRLSFEPHKSTSQANHPQSKCALALEYLWFFWLMAG